MVTTTPPHELETLLAHRAWVRRMAHALIDGAAADDLEQEVWLRTLGRPAPRHPRAWLGTILRRVAANLRRGDRRRVRREAVPRPAPAPADPADLVARAEASERVARATLELDEPYRTVVLLRYFEDLSPALIAEQQGVPIETIRTRLRRARRILRKRLDADGGGRGSWMSAVLPLSEAARPGPGLGAELLVRGVIMSVKAKIVLGGVFAAIVVILLLRGGEDFGSTGIESAERRPTAESGGKSTSPGGGTDLDRDMAPDGRAVSPADASAVEDGEDGGDGGADSSTAGPDDAADANAGTVPEESDAPAGLSVSGVVHDADGKPVTTEVRLNLVRSGGGGATVRGNAGPDGRFTLGPLEPGTYDLEAIPWPPVGTDLLMAEFKGVTAGAENLILRMRRGLTFHGVIVDQEGRRVKGGLLSVTRIMPEGHEQGWQCSIGLDGAFTSFPLDPDLTYDLRLTGPTGAQVAVLLDVRPGKESMRVVLVKHAGVLHGLVVDESGRPIGNGVSVSVVAEDADSRQPGAQGYASTKADGTFRIEGLADHEFRMRLRGGEVISTSVPGMFRPGAEPVRLVAKRGLVVAGKVLDADRRPVKRGRVHVRGDKYATMAPIRPDGSFRLAGLAPGAVRLKVKVGTRTVEMGSYDLPAEGLELVLPSE
jgi:RNA polymerase sigma factor (sigma-70 family)